MRSREEALQCYRIETAKGCFYRMMKDPIWGHLTMKWPVKGDDEAPIPEYIDEKKLIPSETFVLVGYYKDKTHLSWIIEKELYNVRYGDKYALSRDEIGANYLLLYSKDQTQTNLFFKLKNNGAKVYTKSELKKDLKYKTKPSQDLYLIYQLEKEIEKEFKDLTIDLSKLDGLGENKRPVVISLEKLLRFKIKLGRLIDFC